MSVINKMLQDLDARGLKTARSDFSNVRSVPEGTRGVESIVLIALVGAVLVALGGWAIWHYSAIPVAPVAVDQILAQRALVVQVLPVEVATAPPEVITMAPVPATPLAQAVLPPEPKTVDVAPAPKLPAHVPAPAATRVAESQIKPERLEPPQRSEPTVPQVTRAETAAGNARSAGNAAVAANALQMKQANPRQEAENEYRRALGLVQEGRVTAGINGLEQTLRIFPRHDAARQTLIGLLLENRRQDEAMQQLEQGLALDAGQTAMAMTLARLQIERNGPALQTLQRSLPHAQDNADYQGFIGALLQREQRHKEAIEHYTSALRMHPKNGIWWMGLGISLQADQRLPEAKVAFQKAKASGSLEGELLNFVDKKLQQLGR